MAMRSIRYDTGYTLMELMITISIMAIIAGVAVPSYRGLIQSNQVRATSHAFYGSLVLARSEAVKNNLPVVICKSANGTSCSGSGTWDGGWIIYLDADSDSAFDAGEALLESHAAIAGLTLRATDADLHQVIYQADGTQRISANFNVCVSDDVSRGNNITIGLTGRPSSEKGATICP